jgi:hypothetical protein
MQDAGQARAFFVKFEGEITFFTYDIYMHVYIYVYVCVYIHTYTCKYMYMSGAGFNCGHNYLKYV